MSEPSDFTRLLEAAGAREDGWREIFELVHAELRSIAKAHMARERADHTLQATALVNEAWMRLSGGPPTNFENRKHFFAAASRAMERVLVDHARKVLADKRGAGRDRLSLSGTDLAAGDDPRTMLEIADALELLEKEDPRAAEAARLRLFVGLEVAEIAQALAISERTAAREWAFARARLAEFLGLV